MISGKRQKGNRIRRSCIEWLENMGFKVAVIERSGRFIKEKDAYGLFDLMGLKHNLTILVQVAANRPHTHRNFQEFAKEFAGPNLFIVQYVWHDRKGEEIFRYGPSGNKYFWWESNGQ